MKEWKEFDQAINKSIKENGLGETLSAFYIALHSDYRIGPKHAGITREQQNEMLQRLWDAKIVTYTRRTEVRHGK